MKPQRNVEGHDVVLSKLLRTPAFSFSFFQFIDIFSFAHFKSLEDEANQVTLQRQVTPDQRELLWHLCWRIGLINL